MYARIKKILGQIHLWLGLIIGLLFFVIAFSGAIYTWAPEISRIIYHQHVELEHKPFISVHKAKTIMERELPKGDFRTILYSDSTTAIQILLYIPGTYYHAFLHPYTGELLHLQDMKKGWLNYLKMLHRNLLLGDIGRETVHWITLLSFFMLITGLVLWWPVNRASRKQRFTIKWGASPKRLNYDLHNVLGFYATWITIFTVVTGLFWGFKIVKTSLRHITGEDLKTYENPISNEEMFSEDIDQFALMDSIGQVFRKKYPNKHIRVSNPHPKNDPIRVAVIDPKLLVYNSNHFFFDRYTGQRITGNHQNGEYKDKSLFHTLNGLVYDIHLGNIGGFIGRLIVFFASLIAASLPITGFIVWWGKRKK